MKVSVITWDANFREFTHTIDFFNRQVFPESDYEFIWVDFYHSNDRVRQKIEKYLNARLVTLNHSPEAKWHLGKCINSGVAHSSGELLVIPDGDIAVEEDFLSYVYQSHKDHSALVMYFKRYDEPQQASCEQSRTSISYLQQHAKFTNPTNYAGCLTLRRENFEHINGYETHPVFAGPGINGMETYTRLRNAGMAIKWVSDKRIYHPWHPNSASISKLDAFKILQFAKGQYNWIHPYGGMNQSWIVHCRALSGDIVADTKVCDEYLACMPKVDLDYYRKLLNQPVSKNFVSQVLKRASRKFKLVS